MINYFYENAMVYYIMEILSTKRKHLRRKNVKADACK